MTAGFLNSKPTSLLINDRRQKSSGKATCTKSLRITLGIRHVKLDYDIILSGQFAFWYDPISIAKSSHSSDQSADFQGLVLSVGLCACNNAPKQFYFMLRSCIYVSFCSLLLKFDLMKVSSKIMNLKSLNSGRWELCPRKSSPLQVHWNWWWSGSLWKQLKTLNPIKITTKIIQKGAEDLGNFP